jgi:hypothetical protein
VGTVCAFTCLLVFNLHQRIEAVDSSNLLDCFSALVTFALLFTTLEILSVLLLWIQTSIARTLAAYKTSHTNAGEF